MCILARSRALDLGLGLVRFRITIANRYDIGKKGIDKEHGNCLVMQGSGIRVDTNELARS